MLFLFVYPNIFCFFSCFYVFFFFRKNSLQEAQQLQGSAQWHMDSERHRLRQLLDQQVDTAAALAEERARAALVQRSTIEVIGRLQASREVFCVLGPDELDSSCWKLKTKKWFNTIEKIGSVFVLVDFKNFRCYLQRCFFGHVPSMLKFQRSRSRWKILLLKRKLIVPMAADVQRTPELSKYEVSTKIPTP